jgi:outer membrane lipoprotein-sorting protein
MICRSSQMRKPLALLGMVLFSLAAYAEPDAEAILAAARVNPLGEKISLSAQLRTGSKKTPFRIVVDGTVRYQFDQPEQELILELGANESALRERSGGRTATVRSARFDDSVRGTGLTYEDLALKFLYWKNPKLLGEEKVRTRKTWKIEIQSGRESSQYGVARVWVDQQTGVLLRIEGYDRSGKKLRVFEVVSVQKLDDQGMLKSMRVELFQPETGKLLNVTYLEVLGKTEPAQAG